MTGVDHDTYERMLREQYPDDTTPSTTVPRREHLQLVPAEGGPPAPVTFADDAEALVASTIARGRVDFSGAPTWCIEAMRTLVGPMLPGKLTVAAGIPGNGKTALMFTQCSWLAMQGVPTLYAPLETDAEELLRELAAWELGFDKVRVARNQLTPDERARHEDAVRVLRRRAPLMHFVRRARLTVGELTGAVERAVKEFQPKLVVIDHFHRLDFGDTRDRWLAVSEAARNLRDLTRTHQLHCVATAQLSRGRHVLDRYLPPRLDRIKESAAIEEEADVVVTLSRMIGQKLDHKLLKQVEWGGVEEQSLALPRAMRVTCRKHRLDNDALDTSVTVIVDGGKVRDPFDGELTALRAKYTEQGEPASTPPAAPAREPGDEDAQEGLPF